MCIAPHNTAFYRDTYESMGVVEVPAAALWGAQTRRSLQNFTIKFHKDLNPYIFVETLILGL